MRALLKAVAAEAWVAAKDAPRMYFLPVTAAWRWLARACGRAQARRP